MEVGTPILLPDDSVAFLERFISKTKRWRARKINGSIVKVPLTKIELPSISCSSPSKIILSGEHAVVHGYSAIATAVNRCVVTYIFPQSNDRITLSIRQFKIEESWSFSELEKGLTYRGNDEELLRKQAASLDSREIVQIFLIFFAKFGFPLKASLYACDFRVPPASGMGSSASYAVSLLGGILKFCEPSKTESDMLKTIDYWAYAAEKIFHGRPSGIDNAVALHGGIISFRSRDDWRKIESTIKFPLLVLNLKVPKNTKKIVKRVTALATSSPMVVKKIFSCMGCIADELCDMISSGNYNQDYVQNLFQMNHGLLHSLGLQHPKACEVEAKCAQFSLSPKITGAGYGGCLICVVPDGLNFQALCKELSPLGVEAFLVETNQPGVQWRTSFDSTFDYRLCRPKKNSI